MNKGTVIKAGILLGFFIVVIGLSIAFTMIDKDPDVPNISNGSDVYLSTDDIEVTYKK